jgi:hypothetical protein
VIEQLGGQHQALLPGSRVKILEGNGLGATEHRIKDLRALSGGALPGNSRVVYDPQVELAPARVPGENGHTQEGALLEPGLAGIQAGESGGRDRPFCGRGIRWQITPRAAYGVVREHEQLPWKPRGPRQAVGRLESGQVGEHLIEVPGPDGQTQVGRRSRVLLKTPTRDGDERIYLSAHLPVESEACPLARLSRPRGRIETAFFPLAEDRNYESNPLGYPRAALFGFGIGLGA